NSYFGTDLSSVILDKTKHTAQQGGFTNISLACMAAHDIDQLQETDFDVVIINSVIQCFNGHNYLRDVLIKAIAKMKPTGFLFIGDIMDEDKREELITDLTLFKRNNQNKDYHTKTDWGVELFIGRDYLDDLIKEQIGIVEATYTDKIHSITNELTQYRYDALLRIDKTASVKPLPKLKNQYSLTAIKKYDTTPINYGIKSSNLAYVFYTSGTTGKPKGVMVNHSALIIRFEGEKQQLDMTGKLITCMATNFCFDVSLLETLFPLLCGGKTVVLSKELFLSPVDLVKELAAKEVSILQGTPSFMKGILLEGLNENTKTALTHIAVGGESLTETLVNELKLKLPEVVINNHYGPTECVIDAIVLKNVCSFKRNNIGRPLANTQVYILGEKQQLLPENVIGEIYVGGEALATGYLNQEKLTKEKFVTNPFDANTILYKTGDLGRWLPGGNIEFAGRKDDQVKIRGYRIELGEIENAILNYPGIETCFVIAKPNKNGENELVAYLVSQQSLNVSDVRIQLSVQLPSYMLPAYFVQLKQLPLTSNGKVDRKKLPAPAGMDGTIETVYVAPRNETEEKLVNIWQEILGHDRIGVKDNFFEIGGHSLRVIRVLSSVRNEFKIDIKIEEVFSNPTIEHMAKEIARQKWGSKKTELNTDEKIVVTI
ncbi:MAG TPA: AMP-binding protein, partial [Bacteroidia bacterium]|nr:AMP-binding protein [Bacteroidia bacterium]